MLVGATERSCRCRKLQEEQLPDEKIGQHCQARGQCTGPSCCYCSPGVRSSEELSIGHWQLRCLQWCTWSEGEGFTQLHSLTKHGNPCLPCSSGHSDQH
mmetsp:Transcript_36111/g.26330  ORF Transcript_36111/g.26330 Transcript_36111/m.26330 type:complete len:99 (+) Transcript_36111:69-365(+)